MPNIHFHNFWIMLCAAAAADGEEKEANKFCFACSCDGIMMPFNDSLYLNTVRESHLSLFHSEMAKFW